MTANVPAPLFDAPKILEQYLAGKKTKEIAEELGTTPERMIYWLSKNAEEDWRAAQMLKAIERKDTAEEEIDTAEDLMTLRRAEVKLKSAQWVLERVCRVVYGDRAPENDRPITNVGIAIYQMPDGTFTCVRPVLLEDGKRNEEKVVNPEPKAA